MRWSGPGRIGAAAATRAESAAPGAAAETRGSGARRRRGVAATRARNIHAAAAATPRPVHGPSTSRPRRRDPSADRPRLARGGDSASPETEYPRGSRGSAATRPRTVRVSPAAAPPKNALPQTIGGHCFKNALSALQPLLEVSSSFTPARYASLVGVIGLPTATVAPALGGLAYLDGAGIVPVGSGATCFEPDGASMPTRQK